jgi:extradiol dioxygenase
MFQVRSLGYVGVESPQYKVWEDIGPEVFALPLGVPASDGAVRLRVDDYDYRIAVHPGERNRVLYVGWELAREEELEAAIAELSDADVQVTVAGQEECEYRRVGAMAHFRDPAGYRFELFVGLYNRERSFAPTRPHGGFKTGEFGFGHVLLVVPDGAAEDAFVRSRLGFALTDTTFTPGGAVARFYHVNGRHHSLATLSAPGMRGLHHIMLEVNDVDDVGIALDRAESHPELQLSMRLGRHSTDNMLSFYVMTPSGFEIECGWDGRVIGDDWAPTYTAQPSEIWGHQTNVVNAGALEPTS